MITQLQEQAKPGILSLQVHIDHLYCYKISLDDLMIFNYSLRKTNYTEADIHEVWLS